MLPIQPPAGESDDYVKFKMPILGNKNNTRCLKENDQLVLLDSNTYKSTTGKDMQYVGGMQLRMAQ